MITKKEYIEKIKESYNQWLKSDNLKEALKIRNLFHPYSINNRILIHCQNQYSTVCAGYKTWATVKRNVKKGEKGITIYAPAMGYYFDEKVVNGKTEKVKVEYVKGYFPVKIFDVSQTEGEPIETITFEVEGNNEEILEKIKGTLLTKGYMLRYHAESALLGLPIKDKTIRFKQGSPDQELIGIVSSMAYQYMGNFANIDSTIVAASAAYLTMANIGIDASEAMGKYIATLNKFKEFDDIKDFISASNYISKKIERELEIKYVKKAA